MSLVNQKVFFALEDLAWSFPSNGVYSPEGTNNAYLAMYYFYLFGAVVTVHSEETLKEKIIFFRVRTQELYYYFTDLEKCRKKVAQCCPEAETIKEIKWLGFYDGPIGPTEIF